MSHVILHHLFTLRVFCRATWKCCQNLPLLEGIWWRH